jgi:predicted PurR-regulated permease PerM
MQSNDIEKPQIEQRSWRSWAGLGAAIRAITPAQVLQMALVIGGITAVFWLARSTWPALLPFIIGGAVAYTILPFTNALDRVMPRFLAVIISVLLAAGIFAGIMYTIVTVLGRQVYTIYSLLPKQDELGQFVSQIDNLLLLLPPTMSDFTNQLLLEAAERVRTNFDVASAQRVDIFFDGLLTLLNAAGFILGFLVIPSWLLMVLQDQRKGAQKMWRLLPKSLQPDVRAIWRIFDRALRAFLQGQVLLAIFMGVCIYIGLVLFEALGISLVPTPLATAVFAGVLQVIPTVGPAIVIAILLINGFFTGFPIQIILLFGLYIFSLFLVKTVAEPRVEQRVTHTHPAVVVMVVVALSSFGLFWILLAAPVTAVVRDLFVYTYGRLSDPPRPGGLLPGEQLSNRQKLSTKQTRRSRTSATYHQGQAARRASYQDKL